MEVFIAVAVFLCTAIIMYAVGFREGIREAELKMDKKIEELSDCELLYLHLSALEEMAKRVNSKKTNEENPFEEFNGDAAP